MPSATINGLGIARRLEGDGAETIALINGIADEAAARPPIKCKQYTIGGEG